MILGVTGAIGCGKSTVLVLFREQGWFTADADAMCHAFYEEPGGALAAALAERWGDKIVQENGAVSRKSVAEIVFREPAELAFLTGQLYPLLAVRIEELILRCRTSGVDCVFEIPLLFEEKYESRFDAVAAIWSERHIRHERLCRQRNFSMEEIARRENLQLDAESKIERADYAIINNSGREVIARQIDILIQKLCAADKSSAGKARMQGMTI